MTYQDFLYPSFRNLTLSSPCHLFIYLFLIYDGHTLEFTPFGKESMRRDQYIWILIFFLFDSDYRKINYICTPHVLKPLHNSNKFPFDSVKIAVRGIKRVFVLQINIMPFTNCLFGSLSLQVLFM